MVLCYLDAIKMNPPSKLKRGFIFLNLGEGSIVLRLIELNSALYLNGKIWGPR